MPLPDDPGFERAVADVVAKSKAAWRVLTHGGRPQDRWRVAFESGSREEAQKAFLRAARRGRKLSSTVVTRLMHGDKRVDEAGQGVTAHGPATPAGELEASRARWKREKREAERTRRHEERGGKPAKPPPPGARFEDIFTLTRKYRLPDRTKTTGGDVTEWRGALGGDLLTLRITPRARIHHHSFLVPGNVRINHRGDAHRAKLRGGEFLDIEVLDGLADAATLRRLEQLVTDVDERDGPGRPARARRKGERLRAGHRVGQDIFDE